MSEENEKSKGELKFDFIQQQIEDLIAIESENLDAESLRQPKIFSTIQRLYAKEVIELGKEISRMDLLKAKLKKHYGNKGTAEEYALKPLRVSPLKGEIDDLIKIDPEMLVARFNLQVQESIVKFLEDSKWALKERNESLRNAVAFRKLIQG